MFTKSYQWMAKQMAIRNISCNGAPVWAWHSCNKYRHPPTLVHARALLSDIDLIAGIRTIEFECPVELVLLSNYGHWSHLLYDVFPFVAENEIDNETVNKIFDTDPAKFMRYDSIQAALPYLKLDWVKEIRELNLKPDDFTYDPEEEV